MTAYNRIIDALRDNGRSVTETGHAKATAQCPAHDDGRASLSVTGIEGQVLIHCHAGCDSAAVVETVGLTMADLFDERNGARYDYPDGRRSHRTPDKQFWQSGNTKGTSLFHADRIGDAPLVYVVEGEKDVLAVEAAGAVAVCSAMGAGKAHKFDWSPLAGRRVIIVADRDEPGLKHANAVAELLDGKAINIQVLQSAVGKDVADHLAAGKTLTELMPVSSSWNVQELLCASEDDQVAEHTTWEPVDLGPWLNGEHVNPLPTVGISRNDGQKFIYPGREHAVVGETESGKSWFALECAAVEMRMGRDVVYIHYEESNPGSTIERLRLLNVTPAEITKHLRFVAPARPAQSGWLDALLTPEPALVVHDGVNEAMSLHGADIMAADGASTFRRRLIQPCLKVGAATLACDHVPKNVEGRGRDAYGSVHKGNALDGARIVLENIQPFGRGLRGVSHVFITKDRPGQLRAHGKPTKAPGKTFIGTLVVDDSPLAGPDFLTFFAPKDEGDDERLGGNDAAESKLADAIYDIIAAKPDHQVESVRLLMAELRNEGFRVRDSVVRSATDDLIVTGRLVTVDGKRGAKGLRAVLTASQSEAQEKPSPSATASASLLERGRGTQSQTTASDAVGRSGTHSGEDSEETHCRHCGNLISRHMYAQLARGYCNLPACLTAEVEGTAE